MWCMREGQDDSKAFFGPAATHQLTSSLLVSLFMLAFEVRILLSLTQASTTLLYSPMKQVALLLCLCWRSAQKSMRSSRSTNHK